MEVRDSVHYAAKLSPQRKMFAQDIVGAAAINECAPDFALYACDSPQWRDGLVKRGANPTVCNGQK